MGLGRLLRYLCCCGCQESDYNEQPPSIPVQAREILDRKEYILEGDLRPPAITTLTIKNQEIPVGFENPLHGLDDDFDVISQEDLA